MRNQAGFILRIASLTLGALLIVQVVRIAMRSNPLAKISIPAVPTLAGTNAPPAKTTNAPGTNIAGVKAPAFASTNSSTNAALHLAKATGTNSLSVSNKAEAIGVTAAPMEPKHSTNKVTALDAEKPMTNTSVVAGETMALAKAESPTNAVTQLTHSIVGGTNVSITTDARPAHSTNGTNVSLRAPSEREGTNAIASLKGGPSNTNAAGIASTRKPSGSRPDMPMGMPGMPGMGGGKPPAELPPDVKARIDRIYESELLGQVIRPMPAALMGIAGNMAFLRSSSGQTGLVKEGDSLGEMKLVKIGMNRVLIEEKGEKKELMIFNGYGGESLLTKKETSDETTPK